LGIVLAEAADQTPAVALCEMLNDGTGEALSLAGPRTYAAGNGIPLVHGRKQLQTLEKRSPGHSSPVKSVILDIK
jgi:3,4-dihydroxy 2-butanone 4-phosphate synthase